MMDGKDMALMKAALLAGYVDSTGDSMAKELVDSLMKSISLCYQPMYMSDEAGKCIQVK